MMVGSHFTFRDINHTGFVHTQLRPVHFNNDAIPLVVICVAQDSIPVVPRIIRLRTITLPAPVEYFLPVHTITISWRSSQNFVKQFLIAINMIVCNSSI